jgi:CRP/FNR family transcriptional regulator
MAKRTLVDCQSCEHLDQHLFKLLNKNQCDWVSSSSCRKSFPKGEYIFYEGDDPQGIFCISRGKVKLVRSGLHDHNIIVRIAVSGELLGYRALFSKEPYSASAEVIEEAHVCFIPKETIDRLLEKNIQLASALLTKVSRELRNSEERMHRLVDAPLRERLAELLVMLKDQYGTTVRDQTPYLNFKLSRKEMADFLGTTTESVIRALSDFRKEGLVGIEGKEIALTRLAELQKIANLDV